MKHKLSVITLLLLFFFLAQLIGLSLIAYDATVVYSPETELVNITFSETAAGPRPELSGPGVLIYLVIGIGVATILLLGLIKLKLGGKLWKVWYFLAVATALTISFGVLLPASIALLLAASLALLKLYKHNFFIHNMTELFMYAGLAILLAPLLTVFWTIILLFLISLYDAYAVWKSKHMVKLAQFTSKQNLFAGLIVHYNVSSASAQKKAKPKTTKQTTTQTKQAILGGGDIVFPLLFVSTVFIWLLGIGYTKLQAILLSLIIIVSVTASLAGLFIKGKKDTFYPAMPFVTAGCLVGYGLLLLLLFLL
jgi:presenilin-like A22 family membrane protease